MDKSKAGASLILFLLISVSLYLGVGGMERVELMRLAKEAAKKPPSKQVITYNGETFSNPEGVAVAIMQEKVERLFPWIGVLSSFAALALTAGAFGMLGGATGVVKDVVMNSQPLEPKAASLNPTFGFLIGIMVLGVSYVLPAALTGQGDVQLTPAALLFLCFFGGLFSTRVFAWAESLAERLFPRPAAPPLPPASAGAAGTLNEEEGVE